MPGNIKNFLDSFNENLTIAITKQEEKKNVFKTARDKAIKISDTRIGIWPSDASVKTIGDLLGYIFPASGGVKNEPQQLVSPAQPMMTPEYESYLEDRKSSDEIKKAYNDLDRSYGGFRYSLTILKDKGGAQFWFDYFMYFALEFYLKDTTFTDKVKKASLNKNSDIYGLIPGDGKATADYSTTELFEDIIWNNSEYNSYQGLQGFLTRDLAADGLLYLAFVEAGENYSGTYTTEITTSKKGLFKVLDVAEEPKPKTVTPTGPSASGPSASGPSASGPSASEPISSSASTATGVTASGLLKPTFEGIQDGFQISAKTDMPSFSIYVGDPKSWPKLGDVSEEELPEGGENFENIDGAEVLDEEYGEGGFKGEEEGPVDLPTGDIYSNLDTGGAGDSGGGGGSTELGAEVGSASDKSAVGAGPKAGSKLLYKSGGLYFLFNAGNGLAGHRLKNVLTDLTKYLNANGFSGAKLGNNGVMRDLVASTYPSSPARAVASLHGAGLAIDVTFKIPGKSWSGIGDNKNLASDSTLTQTIARWVAGQKDLTWGAEWGKSKPGEGMVQGRGITEYHHFEIKSSLIADYWKPFESDLKGMGFDYKKLNSTGSGGQIYKLNKVLLNSVGIA